MKQLTVLLFLCMMVTSALAAKSDETLISGEVEHGGFGGPVVKLTEINGRTGILVGGRGGWIINHTFVLGGGGYGLASDIKAKEIGLGTILYLDMGYGGLELEYVVNSPKLIHLSFHTLIGAGSIGYRERDDHFEWDDDSDDIFFVAEPGANLMLNVTEFFRIGLGFSYRFINGVDLEGLSDSGLDGVSTNLTLKFGKF